MIASLLIIEDVGVVLAFTENGRDVFNQYPALESRQPLRFSELPPEPLGQQD